MKTERIAGEGGARAAKQRTSVPHAQAGHKQEPGRKQEPNRSARDRGLAAFVQAKLLVSEPDDSYEREADQVADEVMRMPEAQAGRAATDAMIRSPRIQRLCAECEEDVQRKADGLREPATELGPYVAALPGGGQPLAPVTRSFFEPRFGVDLGAVRVHTGVAADRSAQSIDALAYTAGEHIVFRAGQYAPDSSAGQHLLAHELTHVLQQSGGSTVSRRIYRSPASEALADGNDEAASPEHDALLENPLVLSAPSVHEVLRQHRIYTVTDKDRSSEDVGGNATGFRSNGEWLARYNGKTGLNLKTGDVLLVPRSIPVLEAYDVQRENFSRERGIIGERKRKRAASQQSCIDQWMQADEYAQALASKDVARAYHLAVDGVDSDALVCFRPGYAEELKIQSEMAALGAYDKQQESLKKEAQQAYQRYIDRARIVAQAYDVPLDRVINDDYKPDFGMRLPPVQWLLQFRDMLGWDAIGGFRDGKYLSEYGRSLSIDWDTNALEGELGFTRNAYLSIVSQIAANASSFNPYTMAAYGSFSLGGVISHGINDGLTSSEWADLGAGFVFAGMGVYGLKRFGGMKLELPSLSRPGPGVGARPQGTIPLSALDEGVGFSRRATARDIPEKISSWDKGKNAYVLVDRPPSGLEHLSPECMQGSCGFGAGGVAVGLEKLGVPRSQIYINQMRDIAGPGARHVSVVWERAPGELYLVDSTFAQFTGENQAASEAVLNSSEIGKRLRAELLDKGYIRLTDEVAKVYAQAVSSKRVTQPVSAADFTRWSSRWEFSPEAMEYSADDFK